MLTNSYRIREKLETVIQALNPRVNPTNMATSFTGSHPDALQFSLFRITNIVAPQLGQTHPSRIEAEVYADGVWEESQVAIVKLNTELRVGQQPDENVPFPYELKIEIY